MLATLKIENIAIIEKASIEFTEQLNCLSGETGTGKSIIIDSINAILGEKTSRELIRTDAQSAKVTALFHDVSQDIIDIINAYDLPLEPDNSILIQRILRRDGKNVCRINGELITVSMLKKIGLLLINIHGQADNQDLMSQEKHIKYIDQLAHNKEIKNEFSEIFSKIIEIESSLKKLTVSEAEKASKIDLLNFQINELKEANIRAGEVKELNERKQLILNSQKIIHALNEAYSALNGNEGNLGANALIASATDNIAYACEYLPELVPLSEFLSEVGLNLNEYVSDLNSYLYSFSFNPSELNEIEERLDDIYKLSKKYGKTEKDMLEYLSIAEQELEKIVLSDEYIRKLNNKLIEIKKDASLKAEKLSETRKAASKQFEQQVIRELSFLDMPNVSFSVVQRTIPMSENGIDKIDFLLSANKGESLKPLAKTASGGELSRIMLAIKSVLADKDKIETLIFDEIDSGVSGRAASKVALKLKQAASHRQVICVTHLAQIAAVANNHLLINKKVKGEKTYTDIVQLDFEGRKHELARIIGGLSVTELQLKNAEEMLLNNKEI